MQRTLQIIIACTCLPVIIGCQESPDVKFRFNSVEWVKQETINLDDGEHFDESYKRQVGNILTALFGTPDDPKFPFLYEDDDPADDVISLANLRMSAGPVGSDRAGDPAGLYREHCVQCHGITGDGLGPTAAFLNPYPRDFRMGKFKFKSTPLRRPPTNEDLTNVIRRGIPGTAMPSFQTLSPQEVESLVDYVKYLSIRGQLERKLLSEVDSLDGDPILDTELITQADDSDAPEADREQFKEQLGTIVEEFLIEEIVERWGRADRMVTTVPPPPESLEPKNADYRALVDSGRQLYRGKANCVQCHGATGLGDGQTKNYDDWTNDWLNTADANNPESYQHFRDAGALRPRYISPRNLQLAVFRGGNMPEDIYRRIANGIEGTPMPSAPTLTSDEIWALVAFVQQMRYESIHHADVANKQPTVTRDEAIR